MHIDIYNIYIYIYPLHLYNYPLPNLGPNQCPGDLGSRKMCQAVGKDGILRQNGFGGEELRYKYKEIQKPKRFRKISVSIVYITS